MLWIIRGSDRATGALREMQIDAPNERAARVQADLSGVQVVDVHAVFNGPPIPPVPALPYAAPVSSSERRDPTYSIWKDQWILLPAVAGALVLSVAMGLWGEKRHMGDRPEQQVGYYFGTFLGAFLIVYLLPMLVTLVPYLLGGRTRTVARSVFIPLAGLMALGMSGVTFLQHQQVTRRAAVAQQVATQKQIVSDMQNILQGKAPANAAASTATATATAGGQVSQEQWMTLILEAGKGFVTDIKREQTRYQQQIAELYPVPLLDASHFTSGQSLAEYHEKAAKLRQLVDEHQRNCEQLMRAFPDKIRALPIPKALQDQTIGGVNRGYAKSGQTVKMVCDIDRKLCDEMDGLADFFVARLGTYQLRDKTFLFRTGAEAKEYNDHLARIKGLFEEEGRITRQAQDTAKQGMDQVRSAVGQ